MTSPLPPLSTEPTQHAPVPDADGQVTSPAPDITDLLRQLGIIANEPMSVTTTLYVALDVIGRSQGWLMGRIVLRDGRDQTGEQVALWHNREQTKGQPYPLEWPEAPGVPALSLGRPVVVEDLTQNEAFGAAVDSRPPLRGYVAFPIQVGAEPVGTMEFYAGAPLHLSAEMIQVLAHATALLGLVIERGEAQHNLRDSERRFRAIFEQSYQLVSLVERDGTLVDVNQTALRFAGLTAEEVVGQKIWDTPWWQTSPATAHELQIAVSRAARGEPVHYVAELLGEGGRRMTTDFSIKPIRSQEGEIALLIAEGRDITALRQSMERLRLAEARLEEAQHLAQMGHWEYDLATQKAFWSDTLYPVFGLDPQTTTEPGQEFTNRIHPDDLEEVRALLTRAYETRRGYEHVYRLVHPDGSIRSVFGAGNVVVNESGEVTRITGIIQDITNRRRLEEKLARTVDRLSRINAMGQAVASSSDLDQVFEQVMSAARTLLESDLVLLFVHDRGRLHVRAKDQRSGVSFQPWSIPADAGIAGEVWTTGQAVWLSGDECRRRRSEQLAQMSGYEPRAIIAVPVRWQEGIVGVLEAADREDHAFSEDDLEVLQAVATWSAIAIGRARQHAALERRVHESEAIAELSRVLSETLEPQPALELIASTAHRIVPRTSWSVIHLLRGRPERLYPVAWAGDAPPASDYVLAPEEGLAGWVLLHSEALSTDDAEVDPRASGFARQKGMHSLVVAPIQSRNRVLGTISIVAREANVFTNEDKRLTTILAAQAGMAIENAQLYDSQRRARAVAEMQRQRLRELTGRIVTTQEDERLRISRELHDEAGQALTSLKISLDLLRAGLPAEQEALRSRLADVAGLADQTMETLRTLAHDLRPPGLDTFGLNVALEGLCFDFSARTTLPIHYRGVEVPGLPTAVALSMYRLVQEALTNIIKHAEAGYVRVSLARKDGELQLEVVDDGKGFILEPDTGDPRARDGIGLVSMQERAELVGGTLRIETSPGHGTRLLANIPIDPGVGQHLLDERQARDGEIR